MLIINVHKFRALPPVCREQINILLLFPGYWKEKLSDIYEDVHIKNEIDKKKFIDIYNYATAEKYNFLYINVDNGEIRKNFNEEIITNS